VCLRICTCVLHNRMHTQSTRAHSDTQRACFLFRRQEQLQPAASNKEQQSVSGPIAGGCHVGTCYHSGLVQSVLNRTRVQLVTQDASTNEDVEIEYVSAPLDLGSSEAEEQQPPEEETMGMGYGLGMGFSKPKVRVSVRTCAHLLSLFPPDAPACSQMMLNSASWCTHRRTPMPTTRKFLSGLPLPSKSPGWSPWARTRTR
jgi:hypothetical protein